MLEVLCSAAGRHPNVEMVIRPDGLKMTAFGDDEHGGVMVSKMLGAIQIDSSRFPGLLIDETVFKMADEVRGFLALKKD